MWTLGGISGLKFFTSRTCAAEGVAQCLKSLQGTGMLPGLRINACTRKPSIGRLPGLIEGILQTLACFALGSVSFCIGSLAMA